MEKKNTNWGRICFSLLLLSLTNWFPHICAFLNLLVQNCQVKVVPSWWLISLKFLLALTLHSIDNVKAGVVLVMPIIISRHCAKSFHYLTTYRHHCRCHQKTPTNGLFLIPIIKWACCPLPSVHPSEEKMRPTSGSCQRLCSHISTFIVVCHPLHPLVCWCVFS